jgi:formyltetrahydrofolate hydrolase
MIRCFYHKEFLWLFGEALCVVLMVSERKCVLFYEILIRRWISDLNEWQLVLVSRFYLVLINHNLPQHLPFPVTDQSKEKRRNSETVVHATLGTKSKRRPRIVNIKYWRILSDTIHAFDATHLILILVAFLTVHEGILKGESVQKLGSNDAKKLDCYKIFFENIYWYNSCY